MARHQRHRKYRNHSSLTAWSQAALNVAHWIADDAPTRQMAMDAIASSPMIGIAADNLLRILPARTPGGFTVSRRSLRRALAGLLAIRPE